MSYTGATISRGVQPKGNAPGINIVAWALSGVVVVLAMLAWLGELRGSISSYKLFPLFGLLAFSLMWGHYIMAVIRNLVGAEKKTLARYFSLTSWMVLIVMLLHPGLLMWQLWRDGFGLPPGNVMEHYVSPALRGVAALGTVSLLAFLAYELHRFIKNKKLMRWLQLASDVAMVAIFYHGLRLGSHTDSGWYQYVWWFYGVSLLASIIYLQYLECQQRLARTSK